MSDELKPCPFCGKQHEVTESLDMHFGTNWSIDCGGRVLMQAWRHEDIPLLIERWNTRPIEDALRAELEQAYKWLDETKATCKELGITAGNFAGNVLHMWAELEQAREVLKRLEFAASMNRSREVDNRDEWRESYPDYADWEHGDIDEELCQAIDQARAALAGKAGK